MPIKFTKPENLIGRFAVVKPWPDVQAAEDENIARLQITAHSMGLECVVVDPEGVCLDCADQRITGRDVDFVINLHFETPKAYDAYSFVALWNPLRFFNEWGYRQYSKHLLTHDDFLSCSSTWSDEHIRRMIAEDESRLAPHFTMYHSLSEPIFEPTLGQRKVFYAGINWDKMGKKKGRHQELLQLLDKADVMRIHGPRIFNNLNVWEGYQCYVGPVPFDGVSMIKAISEAGIAMVFSSDAHKESELMSNRLFESLAAGAVIICDDNPFAQRHFGDTLLYVDASESPERVSKQILGRREWILGHSDEALEMARAAQEIFKNKFTLDRSLAAIYTGLTERKQLVQERLTPAHPLQEIKVLLMLPEYSLQALNHLLESLETQSHRTLSAILLVDAGDLAAHALTIQNRISRCSCPAEIRPVNFYERRKDGTLRRRILLGRVLAPVIESLPLETLFLVLTPNECWFSGHISNLLRALQTTPESDFAFAITILRHVYKGRTRYDLLETGNIIRNEKVPPTFGRFLLRRSSINALEFDLMRYLDMHALSPLIVRTNAVSSGRATTLNRIQEPFVSGELLEDKFERQILVDRFSELTSPSNVSHVEPALFYPGLVTSLQVASQLTFQNHLLRLQASEGQEARTVRILRQLRRLLLYELFHHESNLAQCEQSAANLPRRVIVEAEAEVTASEKCDSLLAYWVGLCHESAGRQLEALSAFRKALENVLPLYPQTYSARTAVKIARLAFQLKQYEVAAKVLKEIVLKIQPSSPQAHSLLAKINEASGNTTPTNSDPTITTAKTPLVSAIVSAYKSTRFLRGCLEDLENQTIADRLEIIIVDSHSPEDERAIVEEFQERHANIVYIRSEARETVYGAWNRGIKAARGKYITNANTDDRHRPDALEVLARTLDQNPGIALAYGDCLITKIENETFETTKATRKFQWLEFSARDLLLKGCFCGPQPMWRREVHDEHGYFDAEFVSAGDYEFWLKIARTRKFLHVKEVLGLYLESPTSVEHTNTRFGAWEVRESQRRYGADIVPGFHVENLPGPVPQRPPAPAHSKTAVNGPKVVACPDVANVGQLNKARELLGQKEFQMAWEYTIAAIVKRPLHPEAFLLLAEIALAAGDSAGARRCAQRARDLAPGWNMAKQFLKRPIHGNAKLEWLKLPDSVRNTLSVCLIVKNEEKFLGQCLKSIRSVAQQIIVVDTGSTDRTVEIAKEFGAEFYSFAWCDDFAAARNAALEHATCEWILTLDADEELPEAEHEKLRADIRKSDVIAYRLPLVNRDEEAKGQSFVPRLFRNAPGVHYFGRIHEQVFPSLLALSKSWGLPMHFGTAQLLHHGYTKEMVRDRNKIERNLKLLRQAIAENPSDANLMMNFGLELVRSDDLSAGVLKYREAFGLMSAQAADETAPELREVLLTQFTCQLYKIRAHEEIVRVLNSPLAKNGGLTASHHFALGLSQFELKNYSEAAKQMRQCVAKRNQPMLSPINTDILTVAPDHCLALCLEKTGDTAGAEKVFQKALTETVEKNDGKVKLDYAKFLAGQNRFIEALQKLHELVTANARNIVAWRTGGEIALSRPEFLEFARDWTGEAMRYAAEDFAINLQRAEALMLSGETLPASELWERIWNSEREPRILAALILCEAIDLPTMHAPQNGPEEAAASRAFIGWYRKLLTAKAERTIFRLNEQIDKLSRVLPGAARILEATMAEVSQKSAVKA